jgi:uncharacterized SAM-binding protein YcdF (DUF218 family)
MKYSVEKFANKKQIDLNQSINTGTNATSLKDLLEDYAERYYKHKLSFDTKGNETNCMNLNR